MPFLEAECVSKDLNFAAFPLVGFHLALTRLLHDTMMTLFCHAELGCI